MFDAMPAPKEPGSIFGARLREIRKARGLTQEDLARAIDSTQRAITYYEVEATFPPAEMIPVLARVLRVSADELLGLKPLRKDDRAQGDDRLWKKFQQIRDLPERDQRAILRMINNAIVAAKGNGEHRARRRQAVGS